MYTNYVSTPMYVCNLRMYTPMYVCTLCMYSMYVYVGTPMYVCTLCMETMYLLQCIQIRSSTYEIFHISLHKQSLV